MMILAPIAAALIQMAISRSREFAADATGAAIAGNPYGLADALRKIDAIAKRVPLEANPATAHMFIIKPFIGRRLDVVCSARTRPWRRGSARCSKDRGKRIPFVWRRPTPRCDDSDRVAGRGEPAAVAFAQSCIFS